MGNCGCCETRNKTNKSLGLDLPEKQFQEIRLVIDEEDMTDLLEQRTSYKKDDKRSEFDSLDDIPAEQSNCAEEREEMSTQVTRTSGYNKNAALMSRNS